MEMKDLEEGSKEIDVQQLSVWDIAIVRRWEGESEEEPDGFVLHPFSCQSVHEGLLGSGEDQVV